PVHFTQCLNTQTLEDLHLISLQVLSYTLHHQPSVWRWPVAAASSRACSMRWRVTASSKVGQTWVPERQSRAQRTYAWARLEPGPCCGGDQRYCSGTGSTCKACSFPFPPCTVSSKIWAWPPAAVTCRSPP